MVARGFAGAVAAVTAVVVLVVGGVGSSHADRAPAKPDLGPYQGLGSWVDIYEHSSFNDPERAVAGMHAHGVRTLYLETTNYKRKVAMKYPAKQARFIEAAHSVGMKVVAWYLPGFRDLEKDFWRTMKAIEFRTPSGQGFDSFGLDIESPLVENVSVRTERMLQLSQRIRDAVGPSYSLSAIIPSPRGMVKHPDYWPGFPYEELSQIYDLFQPMTYFTWRVSGEDGAHDYTTAVVQLIRHAVGDRSVPIHVIGGISDESTQGEARGFVHAIREQGVIGASYYAYHGTTKHQWWELDRVPANPVQDPALPVRVGYAEPLGNLPSGDHTHPRDVVFQTGRLPGSATLEYQAFDVQQNEVTLRVNWHQVQVLAPTSPGAWSSTQTVRLPARWLRSDAKNYVSFTAAGGGRWAVRTFGLTRS
jgi:hypothetical protein